MSVPLKKVSRAEVAQHNVEGDLWLIFDGKVSDLSSYYPNHPGGRAMLRKAGQDVTYVMHTIPAHEFAFSFIREKLKECQIAVLEQ